jgi:IPTL-CTERM motif
MSNLSTHVRAGTFAIAASLALLAFAVLSASPAMAAQSLYVGNDNTPGSVQAFTLPLTASSTASFGVASNNVTAVGIDASGNMAVGDNAGHLQFFTAPLSGASTPAAAFNNGVASNDGGIAFMNTGDFWASTVGNRVNRFNKPFTNASVPAQFVTDPAMVSAIGVTLDAAQNLYVANAGTGTAITCSSGAGTCSNLLVFAPPYAGPPIVSTNALNAAYRKVALGPTQLFVASVAVATGRVDVYTLPITAASAPAFALTVGMNTPEAVSVDAAGNLYVGNLSDATVKVFNAPITAASVPAVSNQIPGTFAIFSMAIGGFASPANTPVPTLTEWGMVILSFMLALVVVGRLRRR